MLQEADDKEADDKALNILQNKKGALRSLFVCKLLTQQLP